MRFVSRSHQNLAIDAWDSLTTAGINPVVQDVGGTNNLRLANAFTIHGGRERLEHGSTG